VRQSPGAKLAPALRVVAKIGVGFVGLIAHIRDMSFLVLRATPILVTTTHGFHYVRRSKADGMASSTAAAYRKSLIDSSTCGEPHSSSLPLDSSTQIRYSYLRGIHVFQKVDDSRKRTRNTPHSHFSSTCFKRNSTQLSHKEAQTVCIQDTSRIILWQR